MADADLGSVCPFFAPLPEDPVRPGDCAAWEGRMLAVNDAYAERFCLAAEHVACSMYRRAGGAAEAARRGIGSATGAEPAEEDPTATAHLYRVMDDMPAEQMEDAPPIEARGTAELYGVMDDEPEEPVEVGEPVEAGGPEEPVEEIEATSVLSVDDPPPAGSVWGWERPTIESPEPYAEIKGDRIAVRGTAAAGSRVRITDWLTVVATATADVAGRWTADIVGVEEGDHLLGVQRLDARGEVVAESGGLTVSVTGTEEPADRPRRGGPIGWLRRIFGSG